MNKKIASGLYKSRNFYILLPKAEHFYAIPFTLYPLHLAQGNTSKKYIIKRENKIKKQQKILPLILGYRLYSGYE